MDQKIKIQKTVFGLGSFNSVIDTNFTQLARSIDSTTQEEETTNVNKFFEDYNNLFFDIPKDGIENSHQGLAYRSLRYLGVSLEDLLSELNLLREENTELKNQIITSTGIDPGDFEDI